MLHLPAKTCFKRSQGALQNRYFMLRYRIILVKILVDQQVFGFLSVYAPQCFFKDAVKDLFYDQLRAISASASLIPYDNCNDRRGCICSCYKEVHGAEGMRGSWNMLMTCSSVTCIPRNVIVT